MHYSNCQKKSVILCLSVWTCMMILVVASHLCYLESPQINKTRTNLSCLICLPDTENNYFSPEYSICLWFCAGHTHLLRQTNRLTHKQTHKHTHTHTHTNAHAHTQSSKIGVVANIIYSHLLKIAQNRKSFKDPHSWLKTENRVGLLATLARHII